MQVSNRPSAAGKWIGPHCHAESSCQRQSHESGRRGGDSARRESRSDSCAEPPAVIPDSSPEEPAADGTKTDDSAQPATSEATEKKPEARAM